MDEFQYPLFFEAKDLTDREKEKIGRYFKSKRESGGGECGMIEMSGDNICKVCFKEKEGKESFGGRIKLRLSIVCVFLTFNLFVVQERVLQRKFHTISLPHGDLQLTVSRTSSPHTPKWQATEVR